MADVFRPENEDQVRELIAWAMAEKIPVEILGAGTKRGLGRPSQADRAIDLTGLTGILLYEPEELVLSARAGTPLAEIEDLLAENDQELAFEPPDFSGLMGVETRTQTIGGVLACNLAGPRRIKSGAARDHFLGFHGVTGRGEAIVAGGRVVKNVTGYDLCKLIAGSYGTLAAMTEVTLKVLPRGQKAWSLLVYGLDVSSAVAVMTEALGSAYEVSAAAHLPAPLAAASAVDYVAAPQTAVTALRVEGPGPSVASRVAALTAELAAFGSVEELHSRNSGVLWREIGDIGFDSVSDNEALWRLSVAPTAAPAVADMLRSDDFAEPLLDWAGGLMWVGAPADGDGGASVVRSAIAAHGGHATLWRGPEGLRASIDVFQPLAGPLVGLTQRVKSGFDPHHILNPGRIYAGI
ncbi:MAG: glycolate oxidase subunit GlcE [Alphaproteobacteria bacterium]|nr:glycolate oxidase subunit GlcE [Alphaproteobacteria bacterium]